MWARYFRIEPVSDHARVPKPRFARSIRIRQAHRWLAIAFTLTVLANFVVRAWREPPAWITYLPLVPLFLLIFTGLYLFALPLCDRGASKAVQARRNVSQ